jgi:hypothetical protein
LRRAKTARTRPSRVLASSKNRAHPAEPGACG